MDLIVIGMNGHYDALLWGAGYLLIDVFLMTQVRTLPSPSVIHTSFWATCKADEWLCVHIGPVPSWGGTLWRCAAGPTAPVGYGKRQWLRAVSTVVHLGLDFLAGSRDNIVADTKIFFRRTACCHALVAGTATTGSSWVIFRVFRTRCQHEW